MKRTRLIVAACLSLLVLGYVFFEMEWHQVWLTFKSISPIWLLAALVFHLLTYALRTYRFQVLLGLQAGFLQMMGATSLYGMYLYLLPVRTGEVTFPLLFKEHLQIPLTRSTAALLVARFLDLIIMAFLLPFLLASQWANLSATLRLVIAGVCLLVFLGWVMLTWLLNKPEKFDALLSRAESAQFELVVKVAEIAARIYQEMQIIFSQKKFWPSSLISAGIWFFVQCTLYSIITSLGYQVTLMNIYVVTLILIPVTLVPLQGFANLGTHEVSIIAALALFGFSTINSLNIAVGSHIIYIAFSFLLGLTGIILINLSKPSSHHLE